MPKHVIDLSLCLSDLSVGPPFTERDIPELPQYPEGPETTLKTFQEEGYVPMWAHDWMMGEWFRKGFRPCDSEVKTPCGKGPLWTHSILESIDCGLAREQRKGAFRVPKGAGRIRLTHVEFLGLLEQMCSSIESMLPSGIYPSEDGLSSEKTRSFWEILDESRKSEKGGSRYKQWKRFIKLFFFRGHKAGKAEQILNAMHLKMLNFTDLQVGLGRTSILGALITQSVLNPTRFMKAYKTWITVQERQLFGYDCRVIPEIPAEDLLLSERVFRELRALPCFTEVTDDVRTPVQYETTLKWLAVFVPTRDFPCPEPDGQAEALEKLTAFITTNDHPGTVVSKEKAVQFREEVWGRRLDTFLTNCMSSDMLLSAEKRRNQEILDGTKVCPFNLSSSATFDTKRKDGGHYGEILNSVLPFLTEEIGKTFPFRAHSDAGETYVCDDFGNLLCLSSHSHLPVWKAAYVDPDSFGEAEFLQEEMDEQAGRTRIAGLDARFGSLLYLFATSECRKWVDTIETIERLGLDIHKLDQTALASLAEQGIVFPKERLVPVLEPGGKTRWVSATEAAFVYFQLPQSDLLRDLATLLPGTRAGLQQDNHLFRFEQAFGDHTLSNILQKGHSREPPVSPEDVLDIIGRHGRKITIEDIDPKALVQVQLRIARRLAGRYNTPILAALISMHPLEYHTGYTELLVTEVIKDEDCLSELRRVTTGIEEKEIVSDLLSSRDWFSFERHLRAIPEIRDNLITCNTTDMTQATDTIRHDLGEAYMMDLLQKVGLIS
jgi:hypothetical protein